jgi:cysteinyl-tRNA synthetase
MPLVLHDTLQRQKVEFTPRDPEPGHGQRITLYVCGPTVYNYAHIGNARPVVVFDVLFRLLQRLYPDAEVVYARNITDVEDKINAAATEQGVTIKKITDKYTDIYNRDMAALGALTPTLQPRATAHMRDMVRLIETLIAGGSAYVSEGEVLFDVVAYEAGGGQYGALSGRSLDDMIAGARVDVAENKRNAADFVLWKPSKEGEPEWDGPKGLKGRPGWHIECSAMSEAVLGLPIDIHGGGHDLIFPHHTNEIAQSCAAHGAKDPTDYARYWMHNGFLDFSGEKMSKSLGNVVLVHDLVKMHPGEVVRWALLSGHYRSPLDWTPDLLEQSRKALDRLYQTLRDAKDKLPSLTSRPSQTPLSVLTKGSGSKFLDALLDDLNTPQALAELFATANDLRAAFSNKKADGWERATQAHYRDLIQAGELLGLLQQDTDAWFEGGADQGLKDKVEALIAERIEARANKDFAAADRIRDALTALNVVVMDGPEGATWRLKEG